MAFLEFERLSPNRDRAAHEGLGALFHHSELGFAETIARMLDPASRVSYHCLIDVDGTRCTLVPDGQVAWHAGASRFLGRDRCNDFLLGVSFAGDTYRAPLSGPQIASALEWLQARWARLGWGIDRIADHRLVSPGRKRDLNPAEWDRLIGAVAQHFGGGAPRGSVSGLKSLPRSRRKNPPQFP
ncbi:MAG TPA: N-acetylmuramoyl-L-alanine amidase [Opitutaceae bacterium]|nr:N-acetylmuramoyl-L-alanine amidase [Opitutaceae bacterium]